MRTAILTLIVGLVLQPAVLATSARAEVDVEKAVASGFDALILRPVGLVSAAIGAVLFVPAAAFAWPAGRDGFNQAWEQFVTVQVENTFTRKLGDL